ncbi:hypothetical protein C5167_050525 [Papaver somniferum]|uniref:Bulb-type lectin domain-containing protein n=1 Tax=Papaver somniferum TaxID=3469 RepID=A0A4Y7KRR8_PAPSO|nr:mannose-specific lectin-like [Papaver somniferum]RZC75050.1 hypothetical protein C5167_050525 [Papaver somniferum]
MGFSYKLFLLTLAILAVFGEAEDTIFSGEKLSSGQFIENPPYKFIMQNDCNLVLYKLDKALWASNTRGHGDECVVLLQKNGNLVMSSGSDVIWSSSSSRGPNSYRLVVQTDGNVVIYGGATWATNTMQSSKKLHTKVNILAGP